MTWKWRPSRSFPLCVAFGHSVYYSNRKVTSTTTRSHYFHQLANPAPTFVHIYFQSRFPIYAPGSYNWTHGTLHAVPRRTAQQWWSRRSETGEWSGSVRKGAQWIMRHCWGHCSVTGFLVPSTLLSEWFSGERHKAPCVSEVTCLQCWGSSGTGLMFYDQLGDISGIQEDQRGREGSKRTAVGFGYGIFGCCFKFV